jgi:hypothetical protein
MFNKNKIRLLYIFLGLKEPDEYENSLTIGNPNLIPITTQRFEELERKYSKRFSEMNSNVYELDKKLDKLIRFLGIMEEDYVGIDSFGNKTISQKFVKKNSKF